MPEISVIIPVYNAFYYLRDAVDSVLAQTFQDFEIIIVDDASTDGSFELCKQLYGTKEKIRFYRHEQKKSAGGARNTGLEHARGNYIAFLDSDDLYMPESLATMHQVAEEFSAEVVHSPGCLIPKGDQQQVKTSDEFRTIIFDDMPSSEKPVLLPADRAYRVEKWAERKLYGTIWNKLFRKSFLDKYGIRFEEDILPGEDALFLFRCAFYAERYVCIPDVFYIYRRPDGSATRRKPEAAFIAAQVVNMVRKIQALDDYMRQMVWFEDKPVLQEKVRDFAVRDTDPYFIQPGYHSQGLVAGDAEEVRKAFLDIYGEQGELPYWYFHHYHLVKAGGASVAEGQAYVFPYHLFKEGERTVIYGAGEAGKSFYHQLQRQKHLQFVGIVDKRAKELNTPDLPVQPVEYLSNIVFDAILIAVINQKAAGEIKANLMKMGISGEKIRWQGSTYQKDDFYNNYYFPLLRDISKI